MTTLSRPNAAENTLAAKLIAVCSTSTSGHPLFRLRELTEHRADAVHGRAGEGRRREGDAVGGGGAEHSLDGGLVERGRVPIAQAQLLGRAVMVVHEARAVADEVAVQQVFGYGARAAQGLDPIGARPLLDPLDHGAWRAWSPNA